MTDEYQQQNQSVYNHAFGLPNKGVPPTQGDNGWTELEQLHSECQALTTKPRMLLPYYADVELTKKVKDRRKLLDTAALLNKDAADFNQRLANIHAKHQGRVGQCKNPDELMSCLSIGEEYSEWLTQYQLVVLPSVETILSLYQEVGASVDQTAPLEGQHIPAI